MCEKCETTANEIIVNNGEERILVKDSIVLDRETDDFYEGELK